MLSQLSSLGARSLPGEIASHQGIVWRLWYLASDYLQNLVNVRRERWKAVVFNIRSFLCVFFLAESRVRGKHQHPSERICHFIHTSPSVPSCPNTSLRDDWLDIIRENYLHEIFILTTYTSILLPRRFGWGRNSWNAISVEILKQITWSGSETDVSTDLSLPVGGRWGVRPSRSAICLFPSVCLFPLSFLSLPVPGAVPVALCDVYEGNWQQQAGRRKEIKHGNTLCIPIIFIFAAEWLAAAGCEQEQEILWPRHVSKRKTFWRKNLMKRNISLE